MENSKIFSNGELNVSKMVDVLFKKKGLTTHLVFLIFSGILFYLFLIFSDKEYQVTATLAPVEIQSYGQQSLSLGNVGNLLGMDIGGSSNTNYEKFKELLFSVRAAEIFISQKDPRPALYGNNFDEKTQSFKRLGLGYYLRKVIYFFIGRNYVVFPDENSLAGYINDEVLMSVDRKTQFITLIMFSEDPAFAKSFLSDLVRITDNTLKIQEREVLEESVEYLRNKLSDVSIDRRRAAIAGAITAQMIELSLIQNNTPFAAEFIERPKSSVLPAKPLITSNAIIFVLLSLLASTFYLVIQAQRK